jgi:hypothetical protein
MVAAHVQEAVVQHLVISVSDVELVGVGVGLGERKGRTLFIVLVRVWDGPLHPPLGRHDGTAFSFLGIFIRF